MISRWIDDEGNSTNCTNCTLAAPSRWTFVPLFLSVITALTLLFNIVVLAFFVFYRHLRNLFAIYITTLLGSNIIFCMTNTWMVVIDQTRPEWPFSAAACTIHLYASWVFEGVTMHVHVVITLNRIWAMYFPHSYRTHHSATAAILLITGMVVYVHIIALPGVILDAMHHRIESLCSLNTNPLLEWTAVVMIVVYVGPIVIMAGAYPFLLCRYYNRRRMVSSAASAFDRKRPSVVKSFVEGALTRTESRVGVRGDHSRGFLVLTVMTISVVICWTPLQMYFTVAVFVEMDVPVLRQIAYAMYSLQGALDPVLVVMTMQDLRRTMHRFFCCF